MQIFYNALLENVEYNFFPKKVQFWYLLATRKAREIGIVTKMELLNAVSILELFLWSIKLSNLTIFVSYFPRSFEIKFYFYRKCSYFNFSIGGNRVKKEGG